LADFCTVVVSITPDILLSVCFISLMKNNRNECWRFSCFAVTTHIRTSNANLRWETRQSIIQLT